MVARTAAHGGFDGIQLIRLTAIVMTAFALVPGASPLVGADALEVGGWELALMVSGLTLMLAFPALEFVHEHALSVTLIAYSVRFGLFIPIMNAMISSQPYGFDQRTKSHTSLDSPRNDASQA